MKLELKEDFKVVEQGTHYQLPCYVVEDGKGIVRTENVVDLNFVRGSKLKGEDVEKREGTLHEHLLSAMIYDLQFKNSLVPSREGALIITKLQEAIGWMRQRQVDRTSRNVVGTYQK